MVDAGQRPSRARARRARRALRASVEPLASARRRGAPRRSRAARRSPSRAPAEAKRDREPGGDRFRCASMSTRGAQMPLPVDRLRPSTSARVAQRRARLGPREHLECDLGNHPERSALPSSADGAGTPPRSSPPGRRLAPAGPRHRRTAAPSRNRARHRIDSGRAAQRRPRPSRPSSRRAGERRIERQVLAVPGERRVDLRRSSCRHGP